MKYSISFTATARNDLREIGFYILEESKSADTAISFVTELERAVENLKDFPKSGALPADRFLLSLDYRFLVHQNYLIFYKLIEPENLVLIEAIFNAKRDYVQVMRKHI